MSESPAPIPRAQTRSLQRGLAALEYVAAAGEAGVADVAAALAIPRASAHILLATLAAAGYVSQSKRRGRYRMDLRVLPLAQAVLSRLPVRDRAAPLLHELAEQTDLPAYLAVLFRGDVMTVDRAVPTPRPQARADLGVTNPAYTSSMGKALLAHLPDDELESYLAHVRLEPATQTTITSLARLREELALTRERGYATSEGEHREGVRSVGAAVFDYTSAAVAAVCVRHYVPAGEAPGAALIELVKDTALRISYTLGFGANAG
jgi:DNA-binding IclR family transcriptional regulator